MGAPRTSPGARGGAPGLTRPRPAPAMNTFKQGDRVVANRECYDPDRNAGAKGTVLGPPSYWSAYGITMVPVRFDDPAQNYHPHLGPDTYGPEPFAWMGPHSLDHLPEEEHA